MKAEHQETETTLLSSLADHDRNHISGSEGAALDSDLDTGGIQPAVREWLENYTNYILHDETSAWWMQTDQNIQEELEHANGWRQAASPEAALLASCDILPASLLRLQEILKQEGALDSPEYPLFVRIHELLRTAAWSDLLASLRDRSESDSELPYNPIMELPVWEILHEPRIGMYLEDTLKTVDFTQEGLLEKYGFAFVDHNEPVAKGEVTASYYFSNARQAATIYEEIMRTPGVLISPLYDLSAEEFLPVLDYEASGDQDNDSYPVIAMPWDRHRSTGTVNLLG